MKKGIAIILILSIMMSLSACSHCWMKNPPNHGPRTYRVVIAKEDITQGMYMSIENMSKYFTILFTQKIENYEGCLLFDTYTQHIHGMWVTRDIPAGSPVSLGDFTSTNPVDDKNQYTLVVKKNEISVDIPAEDILSQIQFNEDVCQKPNINIDMVVLGEASMVHADVINMLAQGLSCTYKLNSNANTLRFLYSADETGRMHGRFTRDILNSYRSATKDGPSKLPVILRGTAKCSDHIHKFTTYGMLSVSMRIE